MKLSTFGERFSAGAGIIQLMDDLGKALSVDKDMLMLGGGNPGIVPPVQRAFRQRMQAMLENGDEFERLVGNYDPPQGEQAFIHALVKLLNREYGWGLRPENVAITNGSQSACFMLFNMLAGEAADGATRHIALPLTPEYIGYADQGISADSFKAIRPAIEVEAPNVFKYHVDFAKLQITENTAAICVSRPTNPTGNVLTDDEIDKLSALAVQHDIPLIIDNAYGLPFPSIVFSDATPVWNDHIILCMSLSKLGLPGARTGIVVARDDIIKALYGINAILNLTTGGFGTSLALDMVRSGEIITMSREVIKPFYQQKAERAVAKLKAHLKGLDFYIHKPEGAIFLWLWFKALPITSEELYERLKARGVLVLSGHFFFPGLDEPWQHKHECVRITYSQDDAVVDKALTIIADEVRKAYTTGVRQSA